MSKSHLLSHLLELQNESEVPFNITAEWTGKKITIEIIYE